MAFPVLSLSANDVVNRAYRRIGGIMAGQSAAPDIRAECLLLLNEFVDELLIDETMVLARRFDQYTLTAGQQYYLIGPGATAQTIGSIAYGAIDTVRPTSIEEANIILNTTSPPTRQSIQLLNADWWSRIQVQLIPYAIPLGMWYDGNFRLPLGLGAIYLWPGPLASYQLELYTWQQLQAFADLTTSYALPPAYASMLIWNLADRMIPMMMLYLKGTALAKPMVEQIARMARKTRYEITSYNSHPPVLDGNILYAVGGGNGDWSYLDGYPVVRGG